MYQSYFGMSQRPFGATPQLSAYYPASGQEEALATLRYAIQQGRGIGLLTGMPGTGKTMVCHRLATSIESAFTTAMITNTNMTTVKALLQAILYDLTLPYHGMDEQELRLTLSDFLLGKYAGGGRTVLMIDEAQNLSPALLEEIRMLGNLEGEMDKLLQIVLIGHPRLIGSLRRLELETLNQRIGARATLGSLSDEETVGYIRHQLQYAGAVPDRVFAYDAMRAVYEATAGVPRLINQLCEHSLLLAYVSESACVDDRIVEQASVDLSRVADQGIAEPTKPAPVTPGVERAAHEEFQETVVAKGAASRAVAEVPDAARRGDFQTKPASPLADATTPQSHGEPTEEMRVCVGIEHPLDEIFEQEELIVDPYARMQAGRSGRRPSLKPAAEELPPAPRPATELRTKPQVTQVTAPPPRQAPASAFSFGEVSTVAMAVEIRSVPTLPPQKATPKIIPPDPRREEITPDATPGFVEPTDEPAVFEVGAAVQPGPAAQPVQAPPAQSEEILVIEDRSKRLPSNRGRVDGPQPAVGRGSGAYRRLFTHARKP